MLLISTILLLVILFSLFIVIHELGHFLVAKLFKVKVDEFAIGFPPKVVKLFTWLNTPFVLNAIPLGGYVKIEGESYPEDGKDHDLKALSSKAQAPFFAKPFWQRILIILAGPIANIILTWVLFTSMFLLIGIPVSLDSTRIEGISAGSPAQAAGIQTNTDIIAIRVEDETIPVRTRIEVTETINRLAGQNVTIVTTGPCDSGGCQELAQEYEVYLRKPEETPADQGSLGVSFEQVSLPFAQRLPSAIWHGFETTLAIAFFILTAVGNMIKSIFVTAQLPADLTGIVGVGHQFYSAELVKSQLSDIFWVSGLISMSLAIFNLLPMPALDGGRVMFILIERFISRKLAQRWEEKSHAVGMLLLILLMVVVTARDIYRIVVGYQFPLL